MVLLGVCVVVGLGWVVWLDICGFVCGYFVCIMELRLAGLSLVGYRFLDLIVGLCIGDFDAIVLWFVLI